MRAKTAGSISVSHQSMLRMYPKHDPVASPTTHAIAVDSLERGIDLFKQILKKQMMTYIRKVKLGREFEELCYSI